MRISESVDMAGYFWLPERPDQRLPGVLQVLETGETTLEVIGVFGDASEAFADPPLDLRRIVGVIDGDVVTLEHCFYTRKKIGSRGLSKSTIYVNYLLCGVQYDKNQDIVFSKFSFSLEGLDEWLLISGFTLKDQWAESGASIHFNQPKEIAYKLSDDLTLRFTFGWALSVPSIVTEAKITQKAFITLESNSLRSFEDFLALASKVKNFLCFAIDETVSLDTATFYSHETTFKSEGERCEVPIKFYYKSSPLSDASPKIDWHNMLFRYEHVAQQLEDILTSWLRNYEVSEPAFNLYFATKAGAHKYLDGRFLSLAQGIETLHRRNSKETAMPEAEFEDFIATLVKNCPSNKQEWLKRKMEYANELSLRHRIRQMLEPFNGFYGDSKRRKYFIGKVIDTRNYLTHYDEKLVQQAARGEELWGLCMKLEALFQLHFLLLLGLDKDLIKSLIHKNRAIRNKLEI